MATIYFMLHRYSKIVIWGCNHSVFSLLTKVGIKDPFHLVSMGCFREDFTQSMWQKGCLIMAQHPHKQPSGWYIVQTDCKRWNKDRGYYNTFSNLHVCPKPQGSLRSIRHTINILYATTNNVQVRTRTLCKWVGKCDGKSNENVWIQISPLSHKSLSLPLQADQRLRRARILHRIPFSHCDLHILHLSSAEPQQI